MTMPDSEALVRSLATEARLAAQVLLDLSEGLSLLDRIAETSRGVLMSLDEFGERSASAWRDCEALLMLDDMVDDDLISELEERFFNVSENLEESEFGRFLAQLLEKVERRYLALLDALNKLNAALELR